MSSLLFCWNISRDDLASRRTGQLPRTEMPAQDPTQGTFYAVASSCAGLSLGFPSRDPGAEKFCESRLKLLIVAARADFLCHFTFQDKLNARLFLSQILHHAGSSESLIFRRPRLMWEELNKLADLSEIYPSLKKDQQDCKLDHSLHILHGQCAFMIVPLRPPAFHGNPHGTNYGHTDVAQVCQPSDATKAESITGHF